jgi:hypothetical protein
MDNYNIYLLKFLYCLCILIYTIDFLEIGLMVLKVEKHWMMKSILICAGAKQE